MASVMPHPHDTAFFKQKQKITVVVTGCNVGIFFMAREAEKLPAKATENLIKRQLSQVDQLFSAGPGFQDAEGIIECLKPLIRKCFAEGNPGDLLPSGNLRRTAYFYDHPALADPTLLVSGKAGILLKAMLANWRDYFLTPLIMI
jgi:hypothetical protein